MNIPTLKKVNIAKSEKPEFFDQLDLVNFTHAPVAINIAHLDEQEELLKYIEEYISTNKIRLVPYPVCVLSSENLYSQDLLVIKDLKGAPAFFGQKVKQLNLKENALLKRISLLQAKIKNKNISQSMASFAKYAKDTKEVDKLDRQSRFIAKLMKKGPSHE